MTKVDARIPLLSALAEIERKTAEKQREGTTL